MVEGNELRRRSNGNIDVMGVVGVCRCCVVVELLRVRLLGLRLEGDRVGVHR
jgi:hypothetical protein